MKLHEWGKSKKIYGFLWIEECLVGTNFIVKSCNKIVRFNKVIYKLIWPFKFIMTIKNNKIRHVF